MNQKACVLGIVIGLANALALGQYSVDWHTIDSGGAQSSSGGTYVLAGTIGQPDAGFMTGGVFELTGGFWAAAAICTCPGDTNQDGLKNGDDIQKFVDCTLVGGNCSCADLDGINGVNLDDVAVFADDLIADSECP